MPELPEVETTRRGLEPLLIGKEIAGFEIRQPSLRWPVEEMLLARLEGQRIKALGRRGKYLLILADAGSLLLHLGMSGSLRFLEAPRPPATHDHLDLVFAGGARLRFTDPRRFGSLHFTDSPENHWLLKHLGCEPLGEAFSSEYLRRSASGRRVPIKQLLMNSRVVAGIGNIYASEALYRAGIHPRRASGSVSPARCGRLVESIKLVLHEAIEVGGTTLRDFVDGDGRPGYFQLALRVYGRAGEPCRSCGRPIRQIVLGQRATYYCPGCQR
jgi:formamidopyrimidine-DNA glycosylase